MLYAIINRSSEENNNDDDHIILFMKASRKLHALDSISRSLKNMALVACYNMLGCGVEL